MYPTNSGAGTYASLGLTSRPIWNTPHVTGSFCRDYSLPPEHRIGRPWFPQRYSLNTCPQKQSKYRLQLSSSVPPVA